MEQKRVNMFNISHSHPQRPHPAPGSYRSLFETQGAKRSFQPQTAIRAQSQLPRKATDLDRVALETLSKDLATQAPKMTPSRSNKRTALSLTTATVSACSLGIFCYVMGERISNNPTGAGSSENGSPFQNLTLHSAKELFSSTLNATSTGFDSFLQGANVTLLFATDYAQSTWSSIVELSSRLFENLKSTTPTPTSQLPKPKPLERATLTDAQKDILRIREKYPDQYITTDLKDLSQVDVNSGIFKSVKLAAAVGEAPKAFLRICEKLAGGVVFCPLFQIDGMLFNKFTVDSKDLPRGGPAAREKWLQVKKELGEKTDDLLEAHLKQINASSYDDKMHRAIVYFDSDRLKTPYETIKSNDYTPLPGIDTQSSNRIETWYQSGREENLQILRDVRDTHRNGEQATAWSRYSMNCNSKTAGSVNCEMLGTLPHSNGPMSYNIKETLINPSCSQVTENIKIGDTEHVLSYAINPKIELPLIFNELVNPSLHFGRLAFTGNNGENVQGYVNMPTELPAGMPKTCEEL